jgi:hypothetical protein
MVHLLKPAHSERFVAILDAHYTAWRDACGAEYTDLGRADLVNASAYGK